MKVITTLLEYDKEAAVTDTGCDLYYLTLGLAGEAGEVANKVKKVIRDDRGALTDSRRDAILDELSDCCWYISRLAAYLDYDLEQLANRNIQKLRKRQRTGAIHGDGDTR